MSQKSNLLCTRASTPQRVTSCGAHLHDLAPRRHSSEEKSQRWREVGATVSDLTSSGVEPGPAATIAMSLTLRSPQVLIVIIVSDWFKTESVSCD